MGICQIIWLTLMAMNLGLNWGKQGQPKNDQTYSFGSALIASLIEIALLWGGGFFG